MPSIKIHYNGRVTTQPFVVGEKLLTLLLNEQVSVSSPCGGNGTCGKCKVQVEGEGEVLACTFYPEKDVEVFAPETGGAQVLSAQLASEETLKSDKKSAATDGDYGLAIDIGTTTVVFYWVNLLSGNIDEVHGLENPQIRFGADVITRINHCADEQSLIKLQKLIVDAINAELNRYQKLQPRASVLKISVAANTTMLHLLSGVNPLPMAMVPFIAPFTEAQSILANDLGIVANNSVVVNLLPSASAFVGADIVAGIASLNPPVNIKNYLFLDIGTNGEMAVVTPDKIVACATAAGPAFEGANISCGMSALDGAISGYNKQGYQTINSQAPKGLCGSGLIDVVAFLLDEELLSADGNLTDNFVLASRAESANGVEISLSPQDVREVQLAKSAIYTGIKLLLQEANLSFSQLDSVYLAGGFGNYMNPDSAAKIGLFPQHENVPVVPVGNTSGAGAVLHVVNEAFDQKLNDTLSKMKTIDLSKHPDFELEFAMNMYF